MRSSLVLYIFELLDIHIDYIVIEMFYWLSINMFVKLEWEFFDNEAEPPNTPLQSLINNIIKSAFKMEYF